MSLQNQDCGFAKLLVLVAMLSSSAVAAANDWRNLFSRELRETSRELEFHRAQLTALGEPVVGNTVPQFGFQTSQKPAPPPLTPWVQVDLGSQQWIDKIALVPAMVDFQSIDRSAYGFPKRFRVDVSDDPSFTNFTPLLVHASTDFPPPGIAPILIPAACTARYIRVTFIELAEETHTFFGALGELIALQGNRNIALGGKVTAADSVNIAPRWHVDYLTDGRNPLGPPIRHGVMPEFDAVFAVVGGDGSPAWMAIDLGAETLLEELRLHPLHARQGADIPGFRFPAQFRVELASMADFRDARVIFDDQTKDFPNPGNNPVTIDADGQSGRYLRVTMLKGETPDAIDFALSEIEVQANGHCISTGCTVTTTGDTKRLPPRPISGLTDGFTSYGKLVELPQWLEEWALRAELQSTLQRLEAEIPRHSVTAERRAAWTAGGVVMALTAGAAIFAIRSKRARSAEQERFRTRLARDLHDEIGSNLAGIAVLSETAAASGEERAGDLQEIHRIAHESSEAMREVLWLVGARQEMGIDIGQQMQTAAARLLPGRKIHWRKLPENLPQSWSTDTRRQIFLCFKETLTNIVRHARADVVEISAGVAEGVFELSIRDNGRGFDVATAPAGLGLQSLRDRATAVGGNFTIVSTPGAGTLVVITIPISKH